LDDYFSLQDVLIDMKNMLGSVGSKKMRYIMRSEVLMSLSTMFWDVTECNIVNGYKRFWELSALIREQFSTLNMEESGSYEMLISH
jgi:hypothetical protein